MPNEELTLVKNDQWDPASDPARHQYADKWIFKFNEDQAKVDQIMLSDNTESQTSLSNALGSNNYDRANTELGDRLLQQSAQCTSFLAPDYTKITDVNVRKAIAYAYPYEDMWLATGEVPGVTRVPANSIMPPGMAGKKDFFVDGEQFVYNPEKSKELLKTAGYEPGEFKITMIYYEARPAGRRRPEGPDQGLRGGRLHGQGRSGPGLAVQHLAEPGRQAEQDAEPAWRQLVLRLAVGSHHAPAADEDGCCVQHRAVLRAVRRRGDEQHPRHAARGAG